MTLIRKDPSKGSIISIFLKILPKLFAKGSAHTVERFVGEVQNCAIQGRSMQDSLHLRRYSLEKVGKFSSEDEALLHLVMSKAIGRVNHRYLAVLEKAELV